jgi:hypothetical protein
MTELIIGNPVLVKEKPNSYVVEVTAMHGDADGYDTIQIGPFYKDEDEAALESLLQTLDNMDKAYPYGRSGIDEYYNTEGFMAWFDDADYTEDTYINAYRPSNVPYSEYVESRNIVVAFTEKNNIELPYWPSDVQSNDGSSAGFDKYEIFYYDENLVKYHVTCSN